MGKVVALVVVDRDEYHAVDPLRFKCFEVFPVLRPVMLVSGFLFISIVLFVFVPTLLVIIILIYFVKCMLIPTRFFTYHSDELPKKEFQNYSKF